MTTKNSEQLLKDFRTHPVWLTGAIDQDLRTLKYALECLEFEMYIPNLNTPRLPRLKKKQPRQSEANYRKACDYFDFAQKSADIDDYLSAIHNLGSANRFFGMAQAHFKIESKTNASLKVGAKAANATYSKYAEQIRDFYLNNLTLNGGDLFNGEDDLNYAAEYMHRNKIVPLAFTTIREHLKGI